MRRPRLSVLIVRLARCERGAGLTELALAAPLLAVFAGGIVDLGGALSERFTLQQAVSRSLELLQSGPVESDSTSDGIDYSYLVTEAANAAGVPPANITIEHWLECDNERRSDDEVCGVGQDTARYLRLRIDKIYAGRFFLGERLMTASAAIRVQ